VSGRGSDVANDKCRSSDANRIAFGAWLVAAGVLMLAGMTGALHVGGLGGLWPLLLLAFGLGRLASGRSGYWLIVIGVIFTVDSLTRFGIGDTWPFFVVAVGAKIVWEAFKTGRRPRSITEAPRA
jgi:hypothetical protein